MDTRSTSTGHSIQIQWILDSLPMDTRFTWTNGHSIHFQWILNSLPMDIRFTWTNGHSIHFQWILDSLPMDIRFTSNGHSIHIDQWTHLCTAHRENIRHNSSGHCRSSWSASLVCCRRPSRDHDDHYLQYSHHRSSTFDEHQKIFILQFVRYGGRVRVVWHML